MRKTRILLAVGCVGAIALGTLVPAKAHPNPYRYYGYYGNCPRYAPKAPYYVPGYRVPHYGYWPCRDWWW
jgi:hypothetical protein